MIRTAGLAPAMCAANALLTVPIGCTGYAEGDEVEMELFIGTEKII